MKVEVKEKLKASKGFPKLMKSIYSDCVVLFSADGFGICVVGNEDNAVGSYSTNWQMQNFKDFEGSITLSNA